LLVSIHGKRERKIIYEGVQKESLKENKKVGLSDILIDSWNGKVLYYMVFVQADI